MSPQRSSKPSTWRDVTKLRLGGNLLKASRFGQRVEVRQLGTRTRATGWFLSAALLVALGCGDDDAIDGGSDAGVVDLGTDAGTDMGTDVGAGRDSAPECVAGERCSRGGCRTGTVSCEDGIATCRETGVADEGVVCRATGGECDLEEVCDGVSTECPADALAEPEVVCRPAAGECDEAEMCPGDSPLCPTDLLRDEGVACRAGSPGCDFEEVCDGASPTCPEDLFESVDTPCGGDLCSAACNAERQCGAATCAASLMFDGIDDEVVIPGGFAGTLPFTFETFFYVPAGTVVPPSGALLLSVKDGPLDGLGLGIGFSGPDEGSFGVCHERRSGRGCTPLLDAPWDRWIHVAFVVEAAGGFDRVITLVDDGAWAGAVDVPTTVEDLVIGGEPIGNPSGARFAGRLANVRLWSRALARSEVAALAIGEDPGASSATSTDGLLGWWAFDEGVGQMAGNEVGGGVAGTLGADASAGSDDPTWVPR